MQDSLLFPVAEYNLTLMSKIRISVYIYPKSLGNTHRDVILLLASAVGIVPCLF
jgi:hypothetical protein